jgi:hypothetical protein
MTFHPDSSFGFLYGKIFVISRLKYRGINHGKSSSYRGEYKNQTYNVRINVTYRYVHATIVSAEKQ